MGEEFADDKRRKKLVKLGLDIPPLLTNEGADKIIKEHEKKNIRTKVKNC